MTPLISLIRLSTLFTFTQLVSIACSDFVAIPLSEGCSNYPNYNATTGIAGEFLLMLTSSGNSSVEGYLDVFRHDWRSGEYTFAIPAYNVNEHTALRCADPIAGGNGTLQGLFLDDNFDVNNPTFHWSDLFVDVDATQATINTNTGGSKVGLFSLTGAGKAVDGVFIGKLGQKSATWALQFQKETIPNLPDDWFRSRLLISNGVSDDIVKPLAADEFEGYMKLEFIDVQ